jgi:hypothetical protein
MFCPKCSELQASDETQFCSKCGFPTRGVKILLQNDGQVENEISPRQKGIRQGAKLILLSLILFPAFVFLNAMFPPNDRLVESSPSNTWFEQLSLAILWTIFLAGAAHIAYALVFESKASISENFREETKQINSKQAKNALPPSQSIPVSDFGKWKTTGDLFEKVYKKAKTSGELR